jgi:putative transcriptional regulator
MSLNEKIIQIPSKNITNIFGEFDVHIKKIERSLGITVVARDDSIKIIGNERSTADAVELFTLLNDLAERVGISNVNLSKIKNNKVTAIRFSTLAAICEVLECEAGDILEYQPE